MNPVSREEALAECKEEIAPKADESCKHCGLWGVKVMDYESERWQCAIDHEHRYCEGRCARYKPKLSVKIKRMFQRLPREQEQSNT